VVRAGGSVASSKLLAEGATTSRSGEHRVRSRQTRGVQFLKFFAGN
jgi:hypothetical protein